VKQQSLSLSAWITLSLLAIIWGGSFLAYSLILREVPIFTMVANRVLWASLILWVIIFALRIPLPKLKQCGPLFVMGILNNVIPFSMIAWGQTHIESGLASILNGTTAIFTFVLAAVLFNDERLSRKKGLGVAIAFIGVCIVIGLEAMRNFNIRSLAQLSLIIACISYASAAVWARANIKGIHPIMAATGMLSSASIIMVPLALFIDGSPNYNFSSTTLGAMAFLSFPATAIAYLLYYQGLRQAGSANLSLVTLLVPPMAVIWGALVLSERLHSSAYIGFVLIALGMVIIDGRLLKREKR